MSTPGTTRQNEPGGDPQPRIAAGRVVGGRYHLEELLGIGGSAQVWRARAERADWAAGTASDGDDRRPGPPGDLVAVKLLSPELVPDAAARGRLLDEARAVRRLDHPGIVRLLDVVADASDAALIFEFVPGDSLAQRLDRWGTPGPRVAASLVAELADALEYAHRHGVVHCDVTPGNVIVDRAGQPHLADFGIARLVAEPAAPAERGTVLGTLRYIAPELLAGHGADARADVYSLGAVLYELLAGRPAYDARTPAELVDQQSAGPEPLPAVPAELAALALAALRRDPEARPGTAREVAKALRGWLREASEPAAARRGTVSYLAPAPRSGRRVPATPSRTSHGRAVGALAVLMAVLVVAIGAQALLSGPRQSRADGVAALPATPAAIPAGTPSPSAAPSASPSTNPTAEPAQTPQPIAVIPAVSRTVPSASPPARAVHPPAAPHNHGHRHRRRRRRG